MPFYEIFSTLNTNTSLGVYEYPDELSFRKFMVMLPDVKNLLYNEVNEKEALEIRTEIKRKIQKRLNKIMFELWGEKLLED